MTARGDWPPDLFSSLVMAKVTDPISGTEQFRKAHRLPKVSKLSQPILIRLNGSIFFTSAYSSQFISDKWLDSNENEKDDFELLVAFLPCVSEQMLWEPHNECRPASKVSYQSAVTRAERDH